MHKHTVVHKKEVPGLVLTAYFTRTLIALVFYLSIVYSGCFWQCYWKKNCNYELGQNCNRMLRSLLCLFGSGGGQRLGEIHSWGQSSCGVEEKHVSSKGILTDIRSDSLNLSPEVTVTQKPKNQSPEHMDVVAHRALSPLSAASGASPTAEGMKSVHAGAHLSSQVSHNSPHQHPLY